MKIIKPKKLKKGDTIGILAVSGKINDYEKIEQAKAFFEKEGYNVVVSDTCKTSHRYLAGITDDDCVDVLHSYFQDEKIDMILCARGGYGTIRLLDKIDFNIIKNNPKIFAGYSDITALLNLIYKKTGMITFHSPMPYGDFSCDISCYTKDSFINILNKAKETLKVHFVFIDIPSAFKPYEYEAWYKSSINANSGLWIGDGFAEQYLIKPTKMLQDYYDIIGNNYGYVVENGQVKFAKIIEKM